MLTTLLEIAGMALITAGVAMIYPPAGFIAAGVLILVIAFVRGV